MCVCVCVCVGCVVCCVSDKFDRWVILTKHSYQIQRLQ